MSQRELSPFRLRIVCVLYMLFPFGKFSSLRCMFLRWAGATVGRGVVIMPSAKFVGNYTLIIGDNCFIGHETLLMGAKGSVIHLEDGVSLSSRVTMSTGTHRFSSDGNKAVKEGRFENIKMCEGCGVLMGAVILLGVTIERMAIVAAGSVVNKNVTAYHLVGGCPAKVIRDLRDDASND